MVRKSLLVATLIAVASPAAAQDTDVWSSNRPDAWAPPGVVGANMLEKGSVQLSYRFSQLKSAGLTYLTYPFPLSAVFDYYQVAPLSLDVMTHYATLAFAPSDDLTILANINYSQRHREQFTDGEIYYYTDANNLGDLEVSGLYSVFSEGPYRAHVQAGVLIPTGSFDTKAQTPFSGTDEELLPYDMRPGGGTFAFLPGATAMAQNGVATVGAQLKGAIFFGRNDNDFSPGNRYEAEGWASYRLTELFAVSARVSYRNWQGVEGADPGIDETRDPGNDAFFLGGSRADLPIGVTFMFPEGHRFAGHRLSAEIVYPVHNNFDGLQLAADWGMEAQWSVQF